MDIKKALITAAAKSQRTLLLQSLVDRDGATKTALAIIIEEILRAGIDTIGIVICPGDQAAYAAAAGHGLRASRLSSKLNRSAMRTLFIAEHTSAATIRFCCSSAIISI